MALLFRNKMARNLLVPLFLLSVVLTVKGENFLNGNCDKMQNQLTNINGQISQQANQYNLGNFHPKKTASDRLYNLLDTIKQWQQNLDRNINRMGILLSTKQQQLAIPRVGFESVESSFEKVFQKLEDRNAFQRNELNARISEIEVLREQSKNATEQLQTLKENRTMVQKEIQAMNKIISDLTTDKQKLEAKLNGNPPAVRG
ncbi:uncharacterized protein LOC125954659 [Anopheles darlingi]|uniref:uncharacterized protein LOC125954659 n=1 Tax=Anopheles darlingi TaxID=43151 RepID=UPI0021002FD9|nr:uncharacterized protein LOC125954659 [Anopheles darlingi]